MLPSLENIYRFTGRLAGDDKVKVTGIRMTGYASPEGSYDFNAKLSLGRVNTIRDLVQKRFPGIAKSLLYRRQCAGGLGQCAPLGSCFRYPLPG